MTRRGALELVLLAALTLFSLVPLVVALRLADRTGGVFAGSDGPFVADQFQYMSWIRELGTGVLAANEFDIAPSDRVFLHPMFLLSGLAWKAGVASVPLAYLLWKPVAILAVFLGFRAYVARFLGEPRARLAALGIALFFATPIGALVAWGSLGSEADRSQVLSVAGEMLPATLLWGYLPSAISVGLMPLFLLGAERLVRSAVEAGTSSRRDVLLLSACGVAISWLHPWQGEVVLVTVLAAAALGRFARPYFALAGPLAGLVAPLLYYFLLSRADSAWSLAAEANAAKGHVALWAIAVAVLPLAIPALLGLRADVVDFGERMLRLWPLSAALVYLLLSPSFPQHAFEGVSLPLAVLAVRWVIRLERPLPALAAIGAILTLPGLAYQVDWVRDTIHARGQAHYLRPAEDRALGHLEDVRESGGVLSTSYLGPLVPALTGRQTWVGHPSWTPSFDRRVRATEALFAGRLSRRRAVNLVRSTGAAFVLADCSHSVVPLERLRPLLKPERRFGCATVYRVSRPPSRRRSRSRSAGY